MTMAKDGCSADAGRSAALPGERRRALVSLTPSPRAPESAIPTQGGPSSRPFRSADGPPSLPPGPPVQRLGLDLGSYPPPPSAGQSSPPAAPSPGSAQPAADRRFPDGPSHASLTAAIAARLRTAAIYLRKRAARPAVRWSLIAAACVAQAFLLVSAVAWWVSGGSAVSPIAAFAPSWVGIVHDVGTAGVNLRTLPQVLPTTARDTAARGSRLQVQCGQTGDIVSDGTVSTATWLKTSDGLFVSMLYVRVPDRTSIVSCSDSAVDAPLLPLADPANPALPPPPGAVLGAGGGTGSDAAGATRPGAGDVETRAAPRGQASGGAAGRGAPPAGATGAGRVGSGQADAVSPPVVAGGHGQAGHSSGGGGDQGGGGSDGGGLSGGGSDGGSTDGAGDDGGGGGGGGGDPDETAVG
jgi:hypothetical protein